MTREEMFVHLNALKHITDESSMMWLALDKAIKSLEQEPCEDAISRQAVRHILNHEVKMPIKVWKKLFELVDCLPPVTPQPKIGHCKDCKWWKDSDGAYRRGVGAESQCPINRKEVCEGNGYCFLFESQESEDKE